VGAADSQAVMLHVDPETLMLDEPARSWAPNGFIVYSKLCTHAGCPVGLYLAATQHLTCPCHQSTFNVLDGAAPIYGPAARPLPQLPITMDTDETFMALSDFPEPVGPAFWDMGA
jgi:quinol---cytochrome c reductase iron-sulfur subunit